MCNFTGGGYQKRTNVRLRELFPEPSDALLQQYLILGQFSRQTRHHHWGCTRGRLIRGRGMILHLVRWCYRYRFLYCFQLSNSIIIIYPNWYRESLGRIMGQKRSTYL